MRKILALTLGIYMACTSLVSAADIMTVPRRNVSDENYIFRVKGSDQRFLLLDVTDDKNSKFFLMGIDYYGQMAYNSTKGNTLDPELSLNIAYKLNHTFLTEGFAQSHTDKIYKLPQNVVDHIDFNHVWETEGVDKEGRNRYKTVCGIVMPSQEEFLKYSDKIGWIDNLTSRKDSPSGSVWWLRTGRHNGEPLVVHTNAANTQTGSWTVTDADPFVRPVFYVDRDFFGEVAIDLETAGGEVKKVFKKLYSIGQLKEIYPESDIYNYLDYEPYLKITENSFKNNGSVSKNINKANELSAEVTVKNNNTKAESGVLVMTYYNKYSQSIRTDSEVLLLSPGEERKCTLEILTGKEPSKDEYVKISFISMSAPFEQNTNSLKYYCE